MLNTGSSENFIIIPDGTVRIPKISKAYLLEPCALMHTYTKQSIINAVYRELGGDNKDLAVFHRYLAFIARSSTPRMCPIVAIIPALKFSKAC